VDFHKTLKFIELFILSGAGYACEYLQWDWWSKSLHL